MTRPALSRLLPFLSALLLLGACASDPPPPEPLAVGSMLERSTLYDQNEKPHTIDESVRVIVFAREMEGGKVIRSVLDNDGPQFLTRHRALYIADISGMPSLIASMIAIPKMQDERAYPTLLDRDGSATAAFPSEVGRVTVLLLQELKVVGVEYRGSEGGVRDAVKKHPASKRPR